MRHVFQTDIVSRYIDQRCRESERMHLESHLSACAACKDDFIILQNTVAVLKGLEPLALPAAFDAAFSTRLDEAIREKERRAEQRMRRIPVLLGALASIIFAAVVSVSVMRYTAPQLPAIVATAGEVRVFDRQRGSWGDAAIRGRLAQGDIIKTEGKAGIDIAIPRMYTIRLKGNSEIEIASLIRRNIPGTASFRLRKGQVLVGIDAAFKGSQFKILTPAAEAKALGTKFVVSIEEEQEAEKTWVGVLEGTVEVKSTYEPPVYALAKRTVVVEAGERTEISTEGVPLPPQRLLDREWERLQELYQIGRTPQVALILSNGRHRARELLRPCPIFISDTKPRTIPPLLEEAALLVNEAIQKADTATHRQAIEKLERIVRENPDPRYNPQFLMFIGAYYHYLELHEEAIRTWQEVIARYPASGLASLAQCAIGLVYEEHIGNTQKALEVYRELLERYPDSPERYIAEQALNR